MQNEIRFVNFKDNIQSNAFIRLPELNESIKDESPKIGLDNLPYVRINSNFD